LALTKPEQFATLMREGVPPSGAELAMMGQVARGRFAHWTDEDVDDLYAYLTDLSRRAVKPKAKQSRMNKTAAIARRRLRCHSLKRA
jgi:hypothetical protein